MHNPDVSHDVSRTLNQGGNDAPDHTLRQTGSCEGRNSSARAATQSATRPTNCVKPCEFLFVTMNFRGKRFAFLLAKMTTTQVKRKILRTCPQLLPSSRSSKIPDSERLQGTYQQLGKTFEVGFRVTKICKNPSSEPKNEMCNHYLRQAQHTMKGGECGGNTHADQRRPVDACHLTQHRLSPPRRRRTRTRLSGLSDPNRRRLSAGLHPTSPRTTSASRAGR